MQSSSRNVIRKTTYFHYNWSLEKYRHDRHSKNIKICTTLTTFIYYNSHELINELLLIYLPYYTAARKDQWTSLPEMLPTSFPHV